MTEPLRIERAARAGLSPPVRAVVHAAGVDTEYVRAGRGDAIVLIADDLDSPDVAEQIALLETRYLVLAAAPQLSQGLTLGAWLAGFLEGLGIANAHLLLHSSKATSIGDHEHV